MVRTVQNSQNVIHPASAMPATEMRVESMIGSTRTS